MRLVTSDDDWVVEVLPETPSTNAVLADRARSGAAEGLVIATEHQTAGKGRLDRVWSTPPSTSLTFSVLLRPRDLAPTRWTWLPLLAGLSVTSALRSLGFEARVKWPNDVLLSRIEPDAEPGSGGVGVHAEAKVCGILVERVETDQGPAAVIGIGINTSMGPDDLPVATATSLAIEAGEQVDRTQVLITVLRSLFDHYVDWLADPEQVASTYGSMSATLGRAVRAELPGGVMLHGRAVAVDAQGCLVIATETGPVTMAAGDVVHLRAV